MKILHLNSLDHGGAARAVTRINSALGSYVDSEIFFFKNRKKFFYNFISKPYSIYNKIISNLNNKTNHTTYSSNSVFFSYIPFFIKLKNPDIVHLHWINAGMLNIKDLLKINKPIVWTMHDYWPFSGGYHYPVDESLLNNRENKAILETKKEIYQKINKIKFVAVSKNLMIDAKKSSVLFNKDLTFVNNPLDNFFFKKKNKETCRRNYNIDKNLTILFCSNNSINKKNKNFLFLKNVLNEYSKNKILNLIICGERNSVIKKMNFNSNINVIETGFINSDEQLSNIYNCADITAIPSNKEAFGQIASESCACGTPVIALKNTGLSDVINHKENGYLCQSENINDFINGINWLMDQNKELINERCKNSVSKFSYDNISKEYINIYKEILKG